MDSSSLPPINVPTDAHLSDVDRHLLSAVPANVLLVGPASETDAMVTALDPNLARPITTREPHNSIESLRLPASGTLILKEPGTLGGNDQQALVDWMRGSPEIRIVSTSTVPLLPLVRTGGFLDALYYRLNTLYLELVSN
jgi:hypothetical protein